MPQLTYGIETWGNKTMISEAQNTLNDITRKDFGIQKLVPNLAMYSETGIPPLDLNTKYRQSLLALRARTLNRHTAWSDKWLNNSGI